MLTLGELTQNKLPVALSEELQSGTELMGDSSEGNKASLGAAWRGRPPGEDCFQRCDCSTKGFHQIEYKCDCFLGKSHSSLGNLLADHIEDSFFFNKSNNS